MPFTRFASTSALAAAAAIAVVVAVTSPGDQGTEAVTLTGCLRSGGNPAVYILRGAAAPAAVSQPSDRDAVPAAEDYLLVQIPSSVKLEAIVNRRVAITGVASDAKNGPAPPAEANAAERALKRLTVQEARETAPNCSEG
jgi:hypothetical protein